MIKPIETDIVVVRLCAWFECNSPRLRYVVRLCAWFEGNSPRLPALSNGFPGQCVLPTPEGATAATSITGMQGEHTEQVEGGGVAMVCASHRALVEGAAHPS